MPLSNRFDQLNLLDGGDINTIAQTLGKSNNPATKQLAKDILAGNQLSNAEVGKLNQIIQNQLKGTDLKIVVGNEVKNFYNLIVANSVPLPNAASGYPAVVRDLKGKRIGVNALGASTHLMMNALLKGAGLTPDDVTLDKALALLSLLERVAAEQPVLVAVDDWQWLDPSSSVVLGFVLRRIEPRWLRILATLRTGEVDEQELNKFGDDGWELAAVQSLVSGGTVKEGRDGGVRTRTNLIFKRPKK